MNGAFDKARGLALGISQAGIAIAAITLPLLLASINQAYGWRAGYLTLAILALLPWPFVLLGIGRREQRRPVQAQAATSGRDALRTTEFWVVGLSFAAIAITVSALVVHMVPLLQDAGMSPMAAAGTASSPSTTTACCG